MLFIDDIHEESTGGKHVTRARSWWKRENVNACAAQANMQCWVHQDTLINDAQVETSLREAWVHEGSKDEMNMVLQGPKQYFWKGTEDTDLNILSLSLSLSLSLLRANRTH